MREGLPGSAVAGGPPVARRGAWRGLRQSQSPRRPSPERGPRRPQRRGGEGRNVMTSARHILSRCPPAPSRLALKAKVSKAKASENSILLPAAPLPPGGFLGRRGHPSWHTLLPCKCSRNGAGLLRTDGRREASSWEPSGHAEEAAGSVKTSPCACVLAGCCSLLWDWPRSPS